MAMLVLGVAAAPVFAEETATKKEMPRGGEHVRRDFLQMIDTDKDGNISKAEYLANSEKTFASLDGNSDGMLSKAEIDAKREEWKKKMNEIRADRKAKMDAMRAAKAKGEEKTKTDAAPQ